MFDVIILTLLSYGFGVLFSLGQPFLDPDKGDTTSVPIIM